MKKQIKIRMIGLESGLVRLVSHQQGWQRLFAEEKERLLSAIGGYVLDIQHVGSTGVLGLPAKPIIDIGAAVRNFEEAAVYIPALENIGYDYRGENGIPRRHYFHKGNPRTHHLHMVEIASTNWENMVLFRDYLIRHSEKVRAYAELKASLVQQFPTDRDSYQAGKAPFIEEILRLARQERTR